MINKYDSDKEYAKKPRKTKTNVNNDIDNSKIREYIKNKRLNMGLTQKDMANSIGISARCYQEYEEGRSNIINKYTRKMLVSLGLHIVDENGKKFI